MAGLGATRATDRCLLQFGHASSYPRDLRHLHGRSGRSGPRGGPPRHRLRCGRLPAHERPAARAGHRADRRLCGRAVTASGLCARCLRDRQCGLPRAAGRRPPQVPADGGDFGAGSALHQRPAVAGRARAAGPACAGGGRHPRQDHHHLDAGLDPRERRPATGLSGRRGAAQFRRFGPAGPRPALRDRGRRIRHRVFRQAQQIRALPAANGDLEQPRVRSCRHLPGSGSHRTAI